MRKYLSYITNRLLAPVLLIANVPSYAQLADIENSKVYYISKKYEVDISVDDGELQVYTDIDEKRGFNSSVGTGYSSDRIYKDNFTDVQDIKAVVGHRNAADGKLKKSSVSDIVEMSDMATGGTFYDDGSYLEINYPNIQQYSETHLSYREVLLDPHFMDRFFFSDYIPTEKVEYQITLDEGVEIGWKLYGENLDKLVYSKTENKGRVTHSWKMENVPGYASEKNALGYLHYATHIVVFIKSYKADGAHKRLLGSVEDLFTWYKSLIDQIPETDQADLKAITEQTIGDASTDLEKAKRIFHWVQDNIRYIAFEDGWRGFIPYPASEICEKRYGDCKDMTHLMYEMMLMAGLKAEHAWVGTRRLPYTYYDTPCLSVDNHLILKLTIGDSLYLLDATDSHTPFGVPTSFILSKQTLFTGDDGKYVVHEIPSYTSDDCIEVDSIYCRTIGDKIFGTAYKTIETFEYSWFHNRHLGSGNEKKDFMSDYLQLGQNNFSLIEYDIKDIVPRESTRIDYEYSVPNYINEFQNTYYVNLNLTRPFTDFVVEEGRRGAVKIRFKRTSKSSVVLSLPDGKSCSNLPEAVQIDSEFGSCTASYRTEGNKVHYDRVLKIEVLEIRPDQFEAWNDFLSKVLAVYGTSIEYK